MFKDVKNPRWTTSAHDQIAFDVRMENEETYTTFVTSADDSVVHGRMLFNLAVNGIFGAIADSVEDRMIKGEVELPEGMEVIDGRLVDTASQRREAEQAAKTELDRRLSELQTPEALARAEVDSAFAADRKAKLTALLAVKEQPGWPGKVEWPE